MRTLFWQLKMNFQLANLPALLFLVALMAAQGCSGVGKGMLRVDYLGDTNEVVDKPTPEGFIISPLEAADIVGQHQGRKKTVDDFYADEQFYYVCEGYSGSIPQTAIDEGLKINGKTGEIYDRITESWLPDPRISNADTALPDYNDSTPGIPDATRPLGDDP